MGRYELIKKRYADYLGKIKKDEYIIKYAKLPDRLRVTYIDKSIDCGKTYVEYLNDRILCYGIYGTFSFKIYGVNKSPLVYHDYGILEKIDRNIEINVYDEELALDDMKEFNRDSLGNAIDELDEYDQEDFYSLANDDNETIATKCANIVKFLKDNNIYIYDEYDVWENLGDMGKIYSPQTFMICAIMKTIRDDYKINFIDKTKKK